MTPPEATPGTPSPAPTDGSGTVVGTPRGVQAVVALLVAIAGGFLLYHLYAPQFTARPTELIASTSPAHSIDLNTADRAELLQVPGVGPGMADAILSHRGAVGRFDSVDDLTGVKGVGGKTLEKLRPWVTVSGEPPVERLEKKREPTAPPTAGKRTTADPPLDLNAATEAELQTLPGVGPVLAGRIVAARGETGFASVDDLDKVKGIGTKTLANLRPLVTVKPVNVPASPTGR